MRGQRERHPDESAVDKLVDEVLDELDASCEKAAGSRTLAELIEQLPAPRVDRTGGAR
jgi:hypothetical protein